MSSSKKNAISPSREENFPEWYQQVIKHADLAENAPVRGCMVIKPSGYALWENMQRVLDDMFKATGHVNACFPLLIPLSFLEKEAKHVEGFAKECAVVTHHRLKQDESGSLYPDGKLEEPLIVRPTSETIIGHSYSRWVQSYRDLPILINQWANVMRWELRPRLFLRTSEFFWQEGHTVHATREEAIEETLKMLDVYEDFVENWMAVPVVKGCKTSDERFPGAVDTFTIEAMMQDKKALQAGTSHFLGQNFAKASEIKFSDELGKTQYAWTTSWGVSTRLIGGLIMSHSDDDGLVIPPRLAHQHVVIIPIYKDLEQRQKVLDECQKIKKALQDQFFSQSRIICHIDDREMRGGAKVWDNIKKGIPIRCEIGPRDIESNSCIVGRRDKEAKTKEKMSISSFVMEVPKILSDIQLNLLNKRRKVLKSNITEVDSLSDFENAFKVSSKEGGASGGWVLAPWCEKAINHPILERLKVSPRCIPLKGSTFYKNDSSKNCIFSGKKNTDYVLFAKSY